jgi:hypothetical protein
MLINTYFKGTGAALHDAGAALHDAFLWFYNLIQLLY